VLWAGVRPGPGLSALHGAVTAALGYRPGDRPYHPDVTLVRLDVVPPPGTVEGYLGEQTGFCMAAVRITRFSLYPSVLTPSGPVRTLGSGLASRSGRTGLDEPESKVLVDPPRGGRVPCVPGG
jgi:2'-5' RNA ligase